MHKLEIKKKEILQMWKFCPGYLITAKQRFALNSADAIETSYYTERLEICIQIPNNRS